MSASTMAPANYETLQSTQKPMRSRLRGACEECRAKKTRCDSAKRPGRRCTGCELSNTPCIPTIPKKAQMQQSYITILEARIRRLEGYIQALHPGVDVDIIISKPPQPFSGSSSNSLNQSPYPDIVQEPSLRPASEDDPDDSDSEIRSVGDQIRQLSMTPLPHSRFYYGQASPFMVGKRVSAIRSKITGEEDTGLDPKSNKRAVYWALNPWEMEYISDPEVSYVYPEHDLLLSLVSLYFEKTNPFFPVLHRPTFLRSLASGQHLYDPSFGMTVLLVCAIGSRYSSDPRVISVPDAPLPALSAGWHYYCQVPIHRKMTLFKSSVYDLQYYCLAALYLPDTQLRLVRTVVDPRLGHSHLLSTSYKSGLSGTALFCLDQLANSFLGRPCAISYDSIDLDYPIECDDEYWDCEDSSLTFLQPDGKPCAMTYFVQFIQLCQILASAYSTLYGGRGTKAPSGTSKNEWEISMVAELDSSMNKWKDSLPEYLQWDPAREDEILFHQSATLHATFCYIQIHIHRPFLTRKSTSSFVSLAMCSTAAKTCARIQESAMKRNLIVLPCTLSTTFTSAIIIVLCLWGSQDSGYIGDYTKEMEHLQRCLKILRAIEQRDMLSEAGSMHCHPSIKEKINLSSLSNDDRDQTALSSTHSAHSNSSTIAANRWENQLYSDTALGAGLEAWNYPEATSQVTSVSGESTLESLTRDSTLTYWSDVPTAYNYH
ncbi:putative transcriptional regulatory protein [Psilocybe cubensis]|uniref:Transcriptional regulatory protein n=1 Tax=Psilocybe cubensis TaxID=181762 RepID=A0ACB8GGQ8_PSICU|nr:putative transcriptional regulatory protein [Psilocybe cubensis]KAH9474371.1 putative transcriptional regulatory protein [Psilocybe cubensis]